MDQVTSVQECADLSEDQLGVLERRIAGKFMHIVPWGAVVWGIGNFILWLSLWPLVLMDIIPVWLAFPIATLNVMLSYLPSHEALHNIIAGKGRPLRWLNELVGHVSTIPLVLPYRVLRATHMEHHAHTNDADLDPDIEVSRRSKLDFFKQSLLNRQPDSSKQDVYGATMERLGLSHMMIDALVFNAVYLLLMFTLAWSGHAIEAALLWWIPKQIAITYIEYYLSWAPHTPGVEKGRYRDTRAFKSKLGNLFSMGMQYHIVHHLYPRIPLSLTPAAFRALKPILQRRGCDLGAL